MEGSMQEIRPRDLDRIIADSIQIYVRHFVKCVGAAAMTMSPVVVISTLLWAAGEFATTHADGWSEIPYFIVTECLFPVGTLILFVLLFPLLQGTLIHLTVQHHLRDPVSMGEAFGIAWRRIGDLSGTFILYTVLLTGMLVSAIWLPIAVFHGVSWLFVVSLAATVGIPAAIYFAIKWLFAPQAVMLEKRGPFNALSRSGDLVKRSWWRVFGIRFIVYVAIQIGGWLVVGLVLAIPTLIYSLLTPELSMPWGGAPETTLLVLQTSIAAALLIPFAVIADTLLYLDLRVRKECYTLASMREELGLPLTEEVRPMVPGSV